LGHRDRHGPVSCGRSCGIIFLYLAGIFRRHFLVVGIGQPRDRDELSPAADASRIQDTEVGGILPDLVRDSRARRRADFWVATHRIHSSVSDDEGDPHSPIDGKWWSHMG